MVRVRACALNHLDLWERRGLPRVTIPLPHISGSDVAGEVIAAAAPDVAIGRRVLLQPGVSCGGCAACLSGRDYERPERFQLVKRGSQCTLIHARTGARYDLKDVDCVAAG